MWDIKLTNLDFFLPLLSFFNEYLLIIFNNIINYSNESIILNNYNISYYFPFNSNIIFGFKFLICIAFLILIRGGTPRYRYDYLTKLGWLKFINIIILIFFLSLLNLFVY